MKAKVIKLNGGGTLLYVPVKGVNGIKIKFEFNAGCLNDPKGKHGLAHFCEHIVSGFATTNATKEERRTEKVSFQKRGALTGGEYMIFHVATITEHFEKAINHITDGIANVVIDEKEFEREKNVVLTEIATKNLKKNHFVFADLFNKKVRKEEHFNSAYISAAGIEKEVEKLTIEDVKEYINDYLTLNNLTVSIVGNVSKKAIKNAIKKYIIPRIKASGKHGFSFAEIEEEIITSPKYLFAKAEEQDQADITFIYNLGYVPRRRKVEEVDFRLPVLSTYLREQLFDFIRGENGLCYQCQSELSREAVTRVLFDTIVCKQENVERVFDKYMDYIASAPKVMDEKRFEIIRQRIVETENFDVKTLKEIQGFSKSCYKDFSRLDFEAVSRYNAKAFARLTYDEVNNLYHQLYKQKPHIILISNDEKHKDSTFGKELYSKLKKAMKKA